MRFEDLDSGFLVYNLRVGYQHFIVTYWLFRGEVLVAIDVVSPTVEAGYTDVSSPDSGVSSSGSD
jgi:hypothetical protein